MTEKILYKTKFGKTAITVKKIEGTLKLVLQDTYVHSAYNPVTPLINEDYWDYLLLSRIFLKNDAKNICVLGLGGGTAVHLFNHYFHPPLIDAVEINPTVAKVAKKYFDLKIKGLENVYLSWL